MLFTFFVATCVVFLLRCCCEPVDFVTSDVLDDEEYSWGRDDKEEVAKAIEVDDSASSSEGEEVTGADSSHKPKKPRVPRVKGVSEGGTTMSPEPQWVRRGSGSLTVLSRLSTAMGQQPPSLSPNDSEVWPKTPPLNEHERGKRRSGVEREVMSPHRTTLSPDGIPKAPNSVERKLALFKPPKRRPKKDGDGNVMEHDDEDDEHDDDVSLPPLDDELYDDDDDEVYTEMRDRPTDLMRRYVQASKHRGTVLYSDASYVVTVYFYCVLHGFISYLFTYPYCLSLCMHKFSSLL